MHHWRRFHGIVNAFGQSVFEPDDFTLAKMFRSKGYRTAAVGKWHLGWDWKSSMVPNAATKEVVQYGKRKRAYEPHAFDWNRPIGGGPLAQGFDDYFGDGTINFPPYCFVENDRVTQTPTIMMDKSTFKDVPEGQWEFRPGPMVENWDPYEVLPTLADKAVAWIERQQKTQPFFLYFPLPSPHAPIIPNDEFLGKSKAGAYGDFVFESDAMAGRVLDAIEKGGFAENTLVIFTSDNGPERYAYDRLKNYNHWSSGPSRGLKRDLWEGGHRVPMIVRWPGKVAAGSVSNETVSQVDIAATLANAVSVSLQSDQAIDSYDLTPVLTGADYSKPLRRATVQNTKEGRYAIRVGDWLLVDAKSGEHSKSPAWGSSWNLVGRRQKKGFRRHGCDVRSFGKAHRRPTKEPAVRMTRQGAGRTFDASQTGLFLEKLHLCRAFLRFARQT